MTGLPEGGVDIVGRGSYGAGEVLLNKRHVMQQAIQPIQVATTDRLNDSDRERLVGIDIQHGQPTQVEYEAASRGYLAGTSRDSSSKNGQGAFNFRDITQLGEETLGRGGVQPTR